MPEKDVSSLRLQSEPDPGPTAVQHQLSADRSLKGLLGLWGASDWAGLLEAADQEGTSKVSHDLEELPVAWELPEPSGLEDPQERCGLEELPSTDGPEEFPDLPPADEDTRKGEMAGCEKAGQKKPKTLPVEKVRTNLLQHILSRRAPHSKEELKSLLHRLVFLAKISPELADKRDLAGYWQRLFQSLQHCYQGEGVTGLLLLYPAYVVHTLEAASEVLYAILRDLRDMQPQRHRALVLQPKILVMSHDIPSRLFQQWSYKVLAVPGGHLGYDSAREDPVESIVGECLAMLLKLGTHLLKYPKSPPNLPEVVLEKVPHLIIPQDTIGYLLESRALLGPAQFLQAYDSPLSIVMDSERVWPLPGKVLLDTTSS